MSSKGNSKKDLKESIENQIQEVNKAYNCVLTYEDINSVLIDILHENSKQDPKEQYKI